MSLNDLNPNRSEAYELRFQSLFHEGRGLVFRCNAGGQVDLAALSARARDNYARALNLIGREYAQPVVLRGFA